MKKRELDDGGFFFPNLVIDVEWGEFSPRYYTGDGVITDDTESAEINVVYVADRIVQGEALCVAKIVCNVTLTSGIGGHTTSFMVIFFCSDDGRNSCYDAAN